MLINTFCANEINIIISLLNIIYFKKNLILKPTKMCSIRKSVII